MAELDNADRLIALRDSGLLTKEVQERICHLAYTAARLTEADMAQVNVLDENLQHHACQWPSLGLPTRAATSGGCSIVVLSNEVVQIDDTAAHPITCDMDWVHLYRGYLGSPIRFHDQVIGALCLLSTLPRHWSHTDRMALEGVARLLMLSLEPLGVEPDSAV